MDVRTWIVLENLRSVCGNFCFTKATIMELVLRSLLEIMANLLSYYNKPLRKVNTARSVD